MNLTILKTQLMQLQDLGFWDRLAPNKSKAHRNRVSVQILDKFFFECISSLEIDEFVECGANEAYASRVISGKGVSTLAIEANPVTFDSLTCRGDINFKAMNIGLGDLNGNLEFYIPNACSTAGDATFKPRLLAEYSKISIPVRPLDQVLESEGFGKLRTALWIDVEGFQKEVLSGARKTLKKANCVLLKIEVENEVLFDGQALSEELDSTLQENDFVPVLCDFESGYQYNVVYVKKLFVDHIAKELDTSWRNIKCIRMPLFVLVRMMAVPILVRGKQLAISIFGVRIGNKIASAFGSESSAQNQSNDPRN